MEKLEWNVVLATGIEEIDEQHKRLLEILNQLREVTKRSKRREATAEVLQQMLDYTVYHFDYEEKLLEKAGYKLLPLHRRVHQLFIRRIPEFQQRHAAGEDVLREVHDMLARWLVQHIQNDDRNYAPAVKKYLQQEAEKDPVGYSRTQPTPLAETPPPAKGTRKKRTKLSLWERLSGYVNEDSD